MTAFGGAQAGRLALQRGDGPSTLLGGVNLERRGLSDRHLAQGSRSLHGPCQALPLLPRQVPRNCLWAGIAAPANKELKLTSVCPSFARAPGAGGALTLAA
jgi:hypothetical protein